jgi:hypothetical protein
MVPALREILVAHKTDRHDGPADLVFPTRDGNVNSPGNVNTTIIAATHARADELLEAAGERTIDHVTPHSLRRTFASMLAQVGVAPRRAMKLLGHTDPKFTMGVYQQVLDMSDGGIEIIEKLLGASADELFTTLSERAPRRSFTRPMPALDEKMPSWLSDEEGQEGKNGRALRVLPSSG